MANTTGKKFGGRQKGIPNKLTKELRTVLKDFIYEELKTLQEHLNQLETRERLAVIIKILPYALSKVSSTSHTTDEPVDFGL